LKGLTFLLTLSIIPLVTIEISGHWQGVPGRTILLRKGAQVLRPKKTSIKKFGASNYLQLLGKLLVLALALLIVACTSTTIAISTKTPTPQASPTTEVTTQAPATGSVEVKFTLVEFRIISSVTVFHAGTHYYFVVSNRGHDIHEFMIMPDKPDGSPLPPNVQFKGMLIELEPIMPGTTWTTNFTFSPAPTGRYEIACQMRGHYKAGMRLPITVTN
jgi:uncharacterized cupredoxin-like copper-binding protein